MQTYRCTRCLIFKEASFFYKNGKKLNGLESLCKECVLKRKNKKYAQVKFTQQKTKRLRLLKKVNVLDVNSCTFKDNFNNKDFTCDQELVKEMIEELLCHWKPDQDYVDTAMGE